MICPVMVEVSATPFRLSHSPLSPSPKHTAGSGSPGCQTAAGGSKRELLGPLSSPAWPRGLPAALTSPLLPSLPLPAHLALLGVCLTSEHRDILAGGDGRLAREPEFTCVRPLVLGGEAG